MDSSNFKLRYEFDVRVDKLGGGAFGTVYKAYDNTLDKYVAIKIAEVKRVGDKEFSLLDEFDALKGLPKHVNIANYESVYTFDQMNGRYDYAILQYYPHGNLSNLLKKEDLSFEQKQDIALQLLDGLQFLHDYKVVHRDMKPSNILIHKRKTGKIIPKIADFGLSKRANETQKSRFTNSFGGGTIEYCSPEQLKGRTLRLNTDLWAWAVISYQIFQGKMLFAPQGEHTSGSTEREADIMNQINTKDVSEALDVFPEKWKAALSACLIKDPEERIKSENEIRSILGIPVKVNNNSQHVLDVEFDDYNLTAVVGNDIPEEYIPVFDSNENSSTESTRPKNNVPIVLLISLSIIAGLVYFLSDISRNVNKVEKITYDTVVVKQDSVDFYKLDTTNVSQLKAFIEVYKSEKGKYYEKALSIINAIEDEKKVAHENIVTLKSSAKSDKLKKEKAIQEIKQKEFKLWNNATRSNTLKSYQAYIQNYPNGEYVSIARAKIEDISDTIEWSRAKRINTSESYNEYLRKFPKGRNLELANSFIRSINLSNSDNDSWNKAMRLNTVSSFQQYLSSYPNGKYKNLANKNITKILSEANTYYNSGIKKINSLQHTEATNLFINAYKLDKNIGNKGRDLLESKANQLRSLDVADCALYNSLYKLCQKIEFRSGTQSKINKNCK